MKHIWMTTLIMSGMLTLAPPSRGEIGTLPADILLSSRELAMEEPQELTESLALAGTLPQDIPQHLALIELFRADLYRLNTLLEWVDSTASADTLSPAVGLVCQRLSRTMRRFEEMAPSLKPEQLSEIRKSISQENRTVLAENVTRLLRLVEQGFYGSASLNQATTPLIRDFLGLTLPSPR